MGVDTLYAFLTIFLIFVAFVGFIWLVVRAFKTRVWWGLAVLFFSPITATIYGVRYWPAVKIPYLVYSIAFALLLFTMPKTISAEGGFEKLLADAGIEQSWSQRIPKGSESTFPYTLVDSVSEKVEALLEDRSGTVWAPAPNAKDPRYRTISLADAKDYIGESVILVDRNNVTRVGTLVAVSNHTFQFERRIDSGSIAFQVRARDIKAMKVLVH